MAMIQTRPSHIVETLAMSEQILDRVNVEFSGFWDLSVLPEDQRLSSSYLIR